MFVAQDEVIVITKALTLKEPWASLILTSGKNIENRTWALPPQYIDQWIALHTSKTADQENCNRYSVFPKEGGLGAIIGAIKFVDCHRNWQSSDWCVYGQHHWVIDREKITLNIPVPYRGHLGFWDCDLILGPDDYTMQTDLE
jgi:RimJ/RimL family protein N-acetyltransferase